jgi:hypothetical protein
VERAPLAPIPTFPREGKEQGNTPQTKPPSSFAAARTGSI